MGLTDGLAPPIVKIGQDVQESAEAFEKAMSRVQSASTGAPDGYQPEDTFEPCPCGKVIGGDGMSVKGHDTYRPSPNCFWCHGTGYRLTKRIIRPIPKPDFSEQAALAEIKSLHLHIRKAGKSVLVAADLLEKAGQTKHAAATRAVAEAILKPVEGQD